MQWIAELSKKLVQKMTEIAEIWENTGIAPNSLTERQSALSKHLIDLIEQMLSEERNRKALLERNIDEVKSTIQSMQREMDEPQEDFCSPEFASLNLLPLHEKLTAKKKHLEERKNCLLKQYNDLRSEEEALAIRLGIPLNPPAKFSFAPSKQAINSAKLSIEKMSREKLSRQERLRGIVSRTLECLNRLGESTDSLDDVNKAPLDVDYLSVADTKLKELLRLVANLENDCVRLSDQFRELVSRLDLDECLEKPDLWTSADRLRLETRVDQLLQMRLERIPQIICRCREQLEQIWTFCHVDESKRSLTSTEPTEAALKHLEDELTKWNAFLTRNQEFFDALNKINSLYEQFHQAELKLKDPTVLRNRGGILLKVEKELKTLKQRDIPRAEKVLFSRQQSEDDLWESVRPNGLSLAQYLAQLQQENRAPKRPNDAPLSSQSKHQRLATTPAKTTSHSSYSTPHANRY